MIRTATLADLPALETLASGSGMFLGEELQGLMGYLETALSSDAAGNDAHVAIFAGPDGGVLGAVLAADEQMAQGVLNLLFLATDPDARRQGIGAALVGWVEAAARAEATRLVIIETAGSPEFDSARSLYGSLGYVQEARIRDFYDVGLDKIVFRKQL